MYSRNNVGGDGPMPCKLLVVGEAPGREESMRQKPFVGKSGKEFDHYLWEIGIDRFDVRVENVVRCRPPDNRDPTLEELSSCRYHLEKILPLIQPQVILTLGKYATQWFLGNVIMEDCHGIPFRYPDNPDIIILPAYHPAFGLHDGTNMAKIQDDFQVLKHLFVLRDETVSVRTIKETNNKLVKCELVKSDFSSLDNLVDTLRASDIVAIDTESTVVGSRINPGKDDPWCITLSTKPYEGKMILAGNKTAIGILASHVNKPNILTVLHNALYDLDVLSYMGVYPRTYTCTMTMAYLLQNLPLGLKPLAFRLLNIRMTEYEKLVKSANEKKVIDYIQILSSIEWPKPPKETVWRKNKKGTKQPQGVNKVLARLLKDIENNKHKSIDVQTRLKKTLQNYEKQTAIKIPFPEQASLGEIEFDKALNYATLDAVATLMIYNILYPTIVQEGLNDTLIRDMKILPMIIDMKKYGIRINPQHYHDLHDYFTQYMDEITRNFVEEYLTGIYPYRRIHRQNLDINLASSQQVSRAFYELGITNMVLSSTAKKTTDEHRRTYPKIINLVRSHKEASKLRGTYTHSLVLQADENSRIHSNISTTRTITGRLAMSDPNMQNQPKRSKDGKRIREGFCPDPGWCFLSCDYSQIEMRVAAHVSGDPKMLQLFWDNIDIHSQTAAWIFSIAMNEVDTDLHRQPCKTTGFGILYGIGATGIQAQLLSQGLEFDEQYCQYLIDSWFDTYPMIRIMMEAFKQEARRYGKVRDIFGRFRIVPEVRSIIIGIRNQGLREACNSPIQMGAAGIIKQAMADIIPVCEAYGSDIIKPVLQIHDDLLFEIRLDYLDEIAPQIIYFMENAVPLSIPTPVDPKTTITNWRDLETWIPQN